MDDFKRKRQCEASKRYREKNRELVNARNVAWREKNCDYFKKWREANFERDQENKKKYREVNRDQCRKSSQIWHQNNLQKTKDAQKAYYNKNKEKCHANVRRWREKNPDKVAGYNERRLTYLKNRTPAWANLNKIKELYLERDRLTQKTGIQYHVDHKIPLNGEYISGLHIETNLQVITAKENLSKGNHVIE